MEACPLRRSCIAVQLSLWFLGAIALVATPALPGQTPPEFQMEYTNAQLVPAHWLLRVKPDGSGTFEANGGRLTDTNAMQILAGDIHRSIQLSPALTDRIFATARARKFFAFPCDSHLKVAFQGTKRLSYSGPEGSGSCEFNFSKDKQIEDLSNTLQAVETTLLSGARMEKLLQHDRLGLDEELDNLSASAHEGNALEIGTIRETLTRIADDEQVMDRARRKARTLLTQAR